MGEELKGITKDPSISSPARRLQSRPPRRDLHRHLGLQPRRLTSPMKGSLCTSQPRRSPGERVLSATLGPGCIRTRVLAVWVLYEVR